MDTTALTAAQLVAAIGEGRSSARDALEAQLARIERIGHATNAVVQLDSERARRRADEADACLARGDPTGPLHGLPMTVKDSYDVVGLRTTLGFKAYAENRPTSNATAVERVLAAGAVILGKTNIPELAFDWQADSPIFGRTLNPWDPGRSPGGSTGGGAAAVAARLTPLELGSDGAGSLRVPAHFCGVLTIKPTEHLVSGHGHLAVPDGVRADRWVTACGPVARSVADLRLALQVIAGPDDHQPEVPPVPLGATRAGRPPLTDLRFRWTDELPGWPVTADTSRTIRELAERLAAAGATVERAGPELELDGALETWGEVMGVQLGLNIPRYFRLPFRLRFRRRYGAGPWVKGIVGGLHMDADRLLRAMARRDEVVTEVDRFAEGCDGWILPVASVPAFSHRRIGEPLDVDGTRVPYTVGAGAYASLINLTGHPAVVLPVGSSGEGLPIGVQIVGRRWADMDLLDAADAIEAMFGPWRSPPEPEA